MPVYIEKLPERKASKHSGIRWTPAEPEFSPVAGLLVIDTDKARVEYLVTEFPVGWPGRGFHLEKVTEGTDKAAEAYDVFCSAKGAESDTCDCKGFTYKSHCKHSDAMRALLMNRWI